MLIFTDGSAQGNPGPTGSATIINKEGLKTVSIKKVKAMSSKVPALKELFIVPLK